MTTLMSSPPSSSRKGGVLSQVVSNRRFLAAGGFLILALVGWYVLVWWLGFALNKEPVPWPAGVEVDKEFMMTEFADMIPAIPPRYALLSSKSWNEHAISTRDAIPYLSEETRQELGVGRAADGPRRALRSSNWYMARKFGDLRVMDPQSARDPGMMPCPYWHLDVIYYTGAVDTVPHVPERCMISTGATPLGHKVLTWKGLPENAMGWTEVKVVRSTFHLTDPQGRQSTIGQYYTFSINGHNESDWRMVRWTLSRSVRQKYVYFGKIQFAPLGGNMDDIEAADEAARQFFMSAAVEILSKLPSADAVDELNRRSRSGSTSE